MNTQGATPRPWGVGRNESGHPDVWIVGPDDRLVLSALVGPRSHEEQKANAKHATEAVNTHDRLQAEHVAVGKLVDWAQSAAAIVQAAANQGTSNDASVVIGPLREAIQAVKEARGEA